MNVCSICSKCLSPLSIASCGVSFGSTTNSSNMAFELNGTQYETLSEAITAANALESATITLLSDADFSASYTITGNITLKGNHILTRNETYVGALFVINAGATLTLDELCINENATWEINYETFFDYLYNCIT